MRGNACYREIVTHMAMPRTTSALSRRSRKPYVGSDRLRYASSQLRIYPNRKDVVLYHLADSVRWLYSESDIYVSSLLGPALYPCIYMGRYIYICWVAMNVRRLPFGGPLSGTIPGRRLFGLVILPCSFSTALRWYLALLCVAGEYHSLIQAAYNIYLYIYI